MSWFCCTSLLLADEIWAGLADDYGGASIARVRLLALKGVILLAVRSCSVLLRTSLNASLVLLDRFLGRHSCLSALDFADLATRTALRPTSDTPSQVYSFPILSLSSLAFVFVLAPLVVSRIRCQALEGGLILPSQAVPVLILIVLILIPLRHNAIYGSLRSQDTNGAYSATLLHTAAALLVLQPTLLALVFLSRRLWGFAAACFVFAILLIILFALYRRRQRKRAGEVSKETRESLAAFERGACDGSFADEDEARSVSRSSLIGRRSMASILGESQREEESCNGADAFALLAELMNTISTTPNHPRPPLPLETEVVDPYVSAMRAARMHAGARPNLPPLSFDAATLKSDETMYPPSLVSQHPWIILPDDPLSREEMREMEEFWGIQATWEGSPSLFSLPGLRLAPQDTEREEGRCRVSCRFWSSCSLVVAASLVLRF